MEAQVVRRYDHKKVVAILVKYALKKRLSGKEDKILTDWRSHSPEHDARTERLRDPTWQKRCRQQLEEAPTAPDVWKDIVAGLGAGNEVREVISKRNSKSILHRVFYFLAIKPQKNGKP